MERAELLSRANARSERRFGMPITGSMLDDLVEERLLPAAVRDRSPERRPNYQRDEETLRTLIQVRWLKARGLRRYSQLRIYLWLAYFDVPFAKFREALGAEFSRIRKGLLRRVSSTFGPTKGPPTERDVGTLSRQLGQLDPRLLVDGRGISSAEVVDLYTVMRFGREKNPNGEFYENIIGNFGISSGSIGECLPILLRFVDRPLLNMLSDPDEIDSSMEGRIYAIDEKTYRHAREIFDQLPWIFVKGVKHLSLPAFGNIPIPASLRSVMTLAAKALYQPEYRVGIFALLAVALSNDGDGDIFSRDTLAQLRSIRDSGPGL